MTVYFIYNEDAKSIKVGYTAGTAERRMAQLQTGHVAKLALLGTIPGDMDAERGIHAEFASLRINGEWFRCTDALKEIVGELISEQLPWYHCKGLRIRWKYLQKEWLETFSGHPDPFSPLINAYHGLSDDIIRKAVVRARRFQNHFDRFVAMKSEGKTNSAWRKQIYTQYQTFRNPPEHRTALYLIGWGG